VGEAADAGAVVCCCSVVDASKRTVDGFTPLSFVAAKSNAERRLRVGANAAVLEILRDRIIMVVVVVAKNTRQQNMFYRNNIGRKKNE